MNKGHKGMGVEKKLIERSLGNNEQDFMARYVPITLRYISIHGCSGLKCKHCPLFRLCDKNASKSKELATQVIAMENIRKVQGNGLSR